MQENRKFICTVCGHIHDEEVHGNFDELPKYHNCPECGCGKEEYEIYK